MKVFVAGATGVLGRPTVKALVTAGHEVRGTARDTQKADLLRSLGAEPVELDLFNLDSARSALAGSDAVVNLATKIPPLTRIRWKGAWKENDRLRSHASRILADAAREAGVGAYISESITFIYADGGEGWLTEESPLDVSWISLRSMLDAERATEAFTRAGGRGLSLRFSAFYAPYAQSTLDTLRFARRRMFPVAGRGDNYFSSIHVDDAAAAIVAALPLPAGVYNVTDDEPLRMREYAEAISEATGAPAARRVPVWLFKLIGGGPAQYLLRSQRVSNHRLKEATGWSPQYAGARDGWRQIAQATALMSS